jgi:hypothetical protein
VNTALAQMETFLAEVRAVSPAAADTLEVGLCTVYEAADENPADQVLWDAAQWIFGQRSRSLGERLEALRVLSDHDGRPVRLKTLIGWK